MSKHLTAQSIERLKPPASGQVNVSDKGYPGLYLRMSYGGGKSFALAYKLRGKLKWYRLGTWPSMTLAEAREAWRKAKEHVAAGRDPAPIDETGDNSVKAAVADWLARDQAKNKTLSEVERVFDRDVLPAWGDRPLSSITRLDCMALIDGVSDRGSPIMARRVHTHLARFFRWSVGKGKLAAVANPMLGLEKPEASDERERVLEDRELALIWKAASETPWAFGPIVRLLVLTGCRREEIGGLAWAELRDLDEAKAARIELAGARTKNGKPHTIPLSTPALAIVEKLPRIKDRALCFTSTGKTPFSGWSKAKAQLDECVTELNDGKPLPEWRLHDLRRTIATGLQKLGANLQTIESVLGHVSGSRGGVVGVYQRHSFDQEKREALGAWANHVMELVGERSAKIINMRGRR